jgi:glycosyltransferase involved in cell wall biosynthesis
LEFAVSTPKHHLFDGIICIGGEDWWYHNRGHFDLQVVRRFACRMPVLFVNSLGVRIPNPRSDAKFAHRITRKLKSFGRGLVEVEPNFWVFSPVAVPGSTGRVFNAVALAPQIRLAALRAGIARPVLWVHCPPGADLIDRIPSVVSVLQRTDRFEAFPDGDHALMRDQLARLRQWADLTLYCAPHLAAEERDTVRRQLVVTHGVDLERFSDAGAKARAGTGEPGDLAGIARPRVGFIGGVDHHTFDPELFLAVVDRVPQAEFVLVGACTLPDGWLGGRKNVHWLGRKPYEEIADYMAHMDALIMPWNRSEWIEACNPIKLKEYLAVRRPVVTTDFPALAPWRDCVRVASDADGFANAVTAALEDGIGPDLTERLTAETWDRKAKTVLQEIRAIALDRAGPIRHVATDRAA